MSRHLVAFGENRMDSVEATLRTHTESPEMETSIPAEVVVQNSSESDVRHVYILAQRIMIAGVLSMLSHGKFPLCHWGILLGNMEIFYAE